MVNSIPCRIVGLDHRRRELVAIVAPPRGRSLQTLRAARRRTSAIDGASKTAAFGGASSGVSSDLGDVFSLEKSPDGADTR